MICGFMNLGYIGLLYTWDNRQEGDRNVKVRLDKGLTTDAFLGAFRDVKVCHVQTTMSNHICLAVKCLDHSLNKK